MRKTILAVAFMVVAMVSCQDKTKDKLEDAREAVGSEVEQKMDTVAEKVETAIDSTQSKTGKILEKGAEKLDNAADKLKEAAKK
jgi:F0F1-type ATP synthase membrane subunit b/b'